MKYLIDKLRKSSLSTQAIVSITALASYFIMNAILTTSYINSKFQVPYFVQQTSFDIDKMKGWYAYMIEQGTFGIYFETQLIDFIFIVTVIFAGFSVWTFVSNLHSRDSIFYRLGHVLAYALPIAGMFDIFENLVSFIMMVDPAEFANIWMILYSSFACLKFAAWTVGLLWLVVSLFALVINKIYSVRLKRISITGMIAIGVIATSYSQSINRQGKWTVATGITQPILLDGFNLAVNYNLGKIVLEYSHGVNLEYKDQVLKLAYKDKLLSLKSPYSTGTGLGYKLISKNKIGFDIRAEAKVHKYVAELTETETIDYVNFDLGGGAYFQYYPFAKRSNALKGIVIEPSIRYWANTASSLKGDHVYRGENDIDITHKPYPLDLFANISLGYTFGL